MIKKGSLGFHPICVWPPSSFQVPLEGQMASLLVCQSSAVGVNRQHGVTVLNIVPCVCSMENLPQNGSDCSRNEATCPTNSPVLGHTLPGRSLSHRNPSPRGALLGSSQEMQTRGSMLISMRQSQGSCPSVLLLMQMYKPWDLPCWPLCPGYRGHGSPTHAPGEPLSPVFPGWEIGTLTSRIVHLRTLLS